MNGFEFEDPPEERFRELTDVFDRHPLAYAGYRISHLRAHGRDISETGEIPYVTSPTFPVLLVGYLLAVRIAHLAASALGRVDTAADRPPGHVFSMTSTRGYRRYTFLEVASALQDRDEVVVLLCSPAAEDERGAWEDDGYRTVSHRELHGRIGAAAALRAVVSAVALTTRLIRIDEVEPGVRNYGLYFNFILLEVVKRESVRPLTEDDPLIHTFSPMPYLFASTTPENVFAYQHGIQPPLGDKIMAAPFFAPMTYLLWGEPWRSNFERYVHSGSDVRAVGSPWYEYLSGKRSADRDPRYDVLFVSGSHGLTNDDIETQFESLVRNTIETCDRHGYSLAIKLHPLEEAAWFERRGWETYITSFDDIDEALLDARVSVTNASTAFVESAVLDTPTIVADLWGYGLSSLAPVDNVEFTDGPDVEDALKAAVTGDSFRSPDSRPLVLLDGSVERVLEIVDERLSGRR